MAAEPSPRDERTVAADSPTQVDPLPTKKTPSTGRTPSIAEMLEEYDRGILMSPDPSTPVTVPVTSPVADSDLLVVQRAADATAVPCVAVACRAVVRVTLLEPSIDTDPVTSPARVIERGVVHAAAVSTSPPVTVIGMSTSPLPSKVLQGMLQDQYQ